MWTGECRSSGVALQCEIIINAWFIGLFIYCSRFSQRMSYLFSSDAWFKWLHFYGPRFSYRHELLFQLKCIVFIFVRVIRAFVARLALFRVVIASGFAKQSDLHRLKLKIASSLPLLAMTKIGKILPRRAIRAYL